MCRLLMLGKGVSHTDTKHTGRELSFSSQHHLPTTSGLVLVLLGGGEGQLL